MPTLATGSRLNRRAISGFTLLEILVVLTMAALLMAVVVPAISKGLGQSLNDVARELHIGLRKARADAVTQQQSVRFAVDLEEKSYASGTRVRTLPSDFELIARVAENEVQGQQAGIRFYPDGSSSGGRIGVSEAQTTLWLEVDWLTGRVQLVTETL